MLIFLHGRDSYRSRQKLREIVENYQEVHKSGLNLKSLDCSELDLEDLKNEVQTSSMFGEKKLLVFNNVFGNKEKEKDFLELMKKFKDTEDIILVYEEGEINERNPLVQFFKKSGKVQNFKPLEGEKLRSWLEKEFAGYKTGIDAQAVDKLIRFVGSDSWQLSNEIKKLVNYKAKKRIEAKDIDLLVKPKIETDIFKTIDAIAQKDKRRALSLVHGHLEKGESPLYLFSMINFQFRNLLIVKDLIERNRPYYAILKESKLHPFIVKKSFELAKKFTLSELKKIYQKIFEADLNIKTGKLDSQTALDLLIAEI